MLLYRFHLCPLVSAASWKLAQVSQHELAQGGLVGFAIWDMIQNTISCRNTNMKNQNAAKPTKLNYF